MTPRDGLALARTAPHLAGSFSVTTTGILFYGPFARPLDQIDEARLQALIDAGAAESRIIDYKRMTYGNAHSDYPELLADTSSFANTAGGDLILGMEAVNGIPTAFTPFVDPTDPEILRLEQIVRGLQPRIANVAFRAVPIRAGGAVLVIRIPRSYQAPHRLTRQGSNRFGPFGRRQVRARRHRTASLVQRRAATRATHPRFPVTDAEVDVFEAWFGDLFDELFGPCR
jgi:predicted HTH transcriptional regulator